MTAYAATDQIAEIIGLQAALDAKAIDTAVVHKTGTETIGGAKTFSSSVTVSGSGLFFTGASSTIALNAAQTAYIQYASNNLALVCPGTFRHAAANHLFQDPTQATNYFTASSAGCVAPTKLYVGTTTAGSANAQREVRASSASTPMDAGYDNNGVVRWIIGPNGEITTPGRSGPIKANTDASTVTFNLATSDQHTVTLDVAGATRTLALSNESTGSQQFTLYLTQDATGGRSVVWWSGIKWTNGTPPTLSATGGALDVVTIRRLGSGSYCGFHAGPNMS